VVHGLILSSFSTELHLSQGFFQDLYVLPDRFPLPSRTLNRMGLWLWDITEREQATVFTLGDVGRWRVVEYRLQCQDACASCCLQAASCVQELRAHVNKENARSHRHSSRAIQQRDLADVALASNFTLIGFEKDDNASIGADGTATSLGGSRSSKTQAGAARHARGRHDGCRRLVTLSSMSELDQNWMQAGHSRCC
jgi:hypothetical protein